MKLETAVSLALLALLGVLFLDARCDGAEANERALAAEEAADSLREQSRLDSLEVARANRARESARIARDSALRAVRELGARSPAVVTRWREVSDTAQIPAGVRAVVDSTIAHLQSVNDHWADAFAAQAAELAAADRQIEALTINLTTERERGDSLAVAVTSLKSQLDQSPSVWPTVLLVGGGAILGAAVEPERPLPSAAKWAVGGLVVDIIRRGVMEIGRIF